MCSIQQNFNLMVKTYHLLSQPVTLAMSFTKCATWTMTLRLKEHSSLTHPHPHIRDIFSFAHPDQILSAINLYCSHCYGSMLWDLSSEMAGQFFRAWSTAVKLAWEVPRSTHTYLVNHLLSVNHASFREQILVRYLNFFRKLRKSKATPVKFLAQIVARDIRSTTGRNLHLIQEEANIDPWAKDVEVRLHREPVPNEDMWRLPLLCKLLIQRKEMELNMEKTEGITDLIDSLCSS